MLAIHGCSAVSALSSGRDAKIDFSSCGVPNFGWISTNVISECFPLNLEAPLESLDQEYGVRSLNQAIPHPGRCPIKTELVSEGFRRLYWWANPTRAPIVLPPAQPTAPPVPGFRQMPVGFQFDPLFRPTDVAKGCDTDAGAIGFPKASRKLDRNQISCPSGTTTPIETPDGLQVRARWPVKAFQLRRNPRSG